MQASACSRAARATLNKLAQILCQVVFLALNGLTVESECSWQFTDHSARGDVEHHLTGDGSTEWSGIATPRTHRIRHRDASPPVGWTSNMLSCNALPWRPTAPWRTASRLQLQRHPTPCRDRNPTVRISSVAAHPSIVNQSDTVPNQLNPMSGAFSEFGISSSS